jgi:hypothetical protein
MNAGNEIRSGVSDRERPSRITSGQKPVGIKQLKIAILRRRAITVRRVVIPIPLI